MYFGNPKTRVYKVKDMNPIMNRIYSKQSLSPIRSAKKMQASNFDDYTPSVSLQKKVVYQSHIELPKALTSLSSYGKPEEPLLKK